MEKLVLSAMLIGALSTNLSAQEVTGSYDDQTFNFGLKATPTISWLRVDAEGLSNDGIRIGFTYGLVTEFKFSSNYAFATGINNLGFMIPSMLSGLFSDMLGYKIFFIWVLVATIPAFFAAWFVPFAHPDNKEQLEIDKKNNVD